MDNALFEAVWPIIKQYLEVLLRKTVSKIFCVEDDVKAYHHIQKASLSAASRLLDPNAVSQKPQNP